MRPLHSLTSDELACLRGNALSAARRRTRARPQLELTVMYFNVHIETDDDAVKTRTAAAPLVVSLSKVDTVGKCLEQICAAWQLPADKVRLWDYYNSERYQVLADHAATLASVPLYTVQPILL